MQTWLVGRGHAFFSRLLLRIIQFLASGVQSLFLGVNFLLLLTAVSGELALVAQLGAGIAVEGRRAETLLTLRDVQFTLQGRNFLLLSVDLFIPVLGFFLSRFRRRLLGRVILAFRIRRRALGSFCVRRL